MKGFFFFLFILLILASGLTAQVLVEEGFGGADLPPGWTQIEENGSDGWLVGDSSSIATSFWHIPARGRFAATNDDVCNCDKSRDILLSPVLRVDNSNPLFVSFDSYLDGLLGARGRILLTMDGGQSFSLLEEIPKANTWQQLSYNLGSLSPQQDFRLAIEFSDRGNWSTGMAIDNVRIFQPPSLDAEILSIDVEKFQEVGNISIDFHLKNMGSSVIHELSLRFYVNGNLTWEEEFDSLELSPLADTLLSLSQTWMADSGSALLGLEVSRVNAKQDSLFTGEFKEKKLFIAPQLAAGLALVEHFTQTNCFACAEQNPSFFTLLQRESASVAHMSYHAPFPGQNNDPFFLFNEEEQLERLNFYRVDAIPRVWVQGTRVEGGSFSGAPDGVDKSLIRANAQKKGIARLSIGRKLEGATLSGSLEVEPYILLEEKDWRVFLALIQEEESFVQAPGSNGEREFYGIFRKFMLPDTGVAISSLHVGDRVDYPFTYILGPEMQGQGLRLIAWVQDWESREVLAVRKTHLLTHSSFTDWDSLGFWQEGGVIYFSYKARGELIMRDLSGREIWRKGLYLGGQEEVNLPLGLPNGIYLMTFVGKNRLIHRKIRLNHNP